MRKLRLSSVFLVALWCSGTLEAQEPFERARAFCHRDDPSSKCPGPECMCIPDTLEVTFGGGARSVLEYDVFPPGMPVTTTINLDAKSSPIQGWSFGVDHDDAFLTLTDVTVEGTDAAVALSGGFVYASLEEIQICIFDSKADPRCRHPEPGTGYVEGVVLSFQELVFLAPGRRSIAKANYVLDADPGFAGTEIRFVDYLGRKNSPPAAILIVVNGNSRKPETVIDGWVKQAGCTGTERFLRGDVGVEKLGGELPADGIVNISDAIQILSWLFLDAASSLECKKAADTNDDGRIQLTDAIYLLLFLFSGGPAPAAPFPGVGTDPTEDSLKCCRYRGGVLRAEKAARTDVGEFRKVGLDGGGNSHSKP